jgi:hypothetical protein
MVVPGPRLAGIASGWIGAVSVVVEVDAKVSTFGIPIEDISLGIIDCLAGLDSIAVIGQVPP